MREKGFAPISVLVGVLVVVGIGAGVFFLFSPKPQEQIQVTQPKQTPVATSPAVQEGKTARWKVYTSTAGGFSIKYPPNFTVADFPNMVKLKTVSIRSPDYKASENPIKVISGGVIWAGLWSSNDKSTLEQLKEGMLEYSREDPSVVIHSEERIKVDGVDALKFVWSTPGGWSDEQVLMFIVKNQKRYNLSIVAEKSRRSELNEIFNLMVSTFKFLD